MSIFLFIMVLILTAGIVYAVVHIRKLQAELATEQAKTLEAEKTLTKERLECICRGLETLPKKGDQ